MTTYSKQGTWPADYSLAERYIMSDIEGSSVLCILDARLELFINTHGKMPDIFFINLMLKHSLEVDLGKEFPPYYERQVIFDIPVGWFIMRPDAICSHGPAYIIMHTYSKPTITERL